MSDQTNDMQNPTLNDVGTEAGFGGFSERISYECFKHGSKVGTGMKLLRIGCALIVFGVFLTLCGLVMYYVVNSNKTLYYPDDAEAVPASETELAVSETALPAEEDTSVCERHFFNITADIAHRYNLAEGVLVKDAGIVNEVLGTEVVEGDIITALNDTMIVDSQVFYDMLISDKNPEKSTVTVFRDGCEILLEPS